MSTIPGCAGQLYGQSHGNRHKNLDSLYKKEILQKFEMSKFIKSGHSWLVVRQMFDTINHLRLYTCGNNVSYYTSRKQSLGGGWVYRNNPVHPSMYLVSATPHKPLIGFLLKLSKFVVHYLQMCMKEYGCCPKFKRRDNSTNTFTKRGGMYLVSATPLKRLIGIL